MSDDSKKERRLEDWSSSFLEYTAMIPSPEIFRVWTSYNIISGALERRAWTSLSGKRLYPNMIVMLVSPPGVGKSMAIDEAIELIGEIGWLNLAPSGMTKAGFVDQLKIRQQNFEFKGVLEIYNPMIIAATEFGTLVPDYDREFLNVMNTIYDCGSFFEDRTRGKGLDHVDRPHLNMIAGTQPAYLGDLLPEAAYGMGFMSRVVMIYAGKKIFVSLFKSKRKSPELKKDLVKDLRIIAKLKGDFEWVTDAEDFAEEWFLKAAEDAPKHGKLINYVPRRVHHGLKLAMAIAASQRSDMIVELEDIEKARNMILAAEALMPEIFKEMSVSKDSKELEEMHIFLFTYCDKQKVETVPEHKLMHFISKRSAVNKITYFIDTLIASGMMRVEGLNLPGQRKFRPLVLTLEGK